MPQSATVTGYGPIAPALAGISPDNMTTQLWLGTTDFELPSHCGVVGKCKLTSLLSALARKSATDIHLCRSETSGLQSLKAGDRARASVTSQSTHVPAALVVTSGLEEQIVEFVAVIVSPSKQADKFKTIGIKPPRGALMHGSPGTGKTPLARAHTAQTNACYFKLTGPSLEKAPAISFTNELDAIGTKHFESGKSGVFEVQHTDSSSKYLNSLRTTNIHCPQKCGDSVWLNISCSPSPLNSWMILAYPEEELLQQAIVEKELKLERLGNLRDSSKLLCEFLSDSWHARPAAAAQPSPSAPEDNGQAKCKVYLSLHGGASTSPSSVTTRLPDAIDYQSKSKAHCPVSNSTPSLPLALGHNLAMDGYPWGCKTASWQCSMAENVPDQIKTMTSQSTCTHAPTILTNDLLYSCNELNEIGPNTANFSKGHLARNPASSPIAPRSIPGTLQEDGVAAAPQMRRDPVIDHE